MKKIQFKIDYGRNKAGHVIGTTDSAADQLVMLGVAEYVGAAIRPYKYQVGQALQTECIVPVIEELESAPKGALLPEEIEMPEVQQYETATLKYKKQTLKK